MAETTVHVTDRGYEAMLRGAEVERWPGDDDPPAVGARVVVFDRELEFTQHDVKRVEGRRVWFGPAIPWEESTVAP